jgi:hypothetical protein
MHTLHAAEAPSTMTSTSAVRPNVAQQSFDAKYITAAEIARECKVSRPSVMRARERGALPNAVSVSDGNIYIWEREGARPYIDAWKITLRAKRGQAG